MRRFQFVIPIILIPILFMNIYPSILNNYAFLLLLHPTDGGDQKRIENHLLNSYILGKHDAQLAVPIFAFYLRNNNNEKAESFLSVVMEAKTSNRGFWRNVATFSEMSGYWGFAAEAWRRSGNYPNALYLDPIHDNLIVEDFSSFSRWKKLDQDVNVKNEDIDYLLPSIEIEYLNTPQIRDSLSYFLSFHEFTLNSYTCLEIDVLINRGTFFTVDIVGDHQSKRIANYLEGDGDWKTIRVRVPYSKMDRIHLGLGEPPSFDSSTTRYGVLLREIRLTKDTNCDQH